MLGEIQGSPLTHIILTAVKNTRVRIIEIDETVLNGKSSLLRRSREKHEKAAKSIGDAVMKPYMTVVTVLGMVLLLASGMACSQKRKPLVPLALEGEVKSQAIQFTDQGTQAYQARQFEAAKEYFEQAMAAAPESGQAHYNYALALKALGNVDVARRHFMEAADLAPGNQIIWDSPALAPHGNPETRSSSFERPIKPPTNFPSGSTPY
jgi:tetratricopeptide (TPR) repeat protein